MKKLILVVMTLIVLICSISCSSYSSSTTLLVDSASVRGLQMDKVTSFDIKDIQK